MAEDTKKPSGPFTLPPLPYDEGALAPTISAETMKLHHGKHHKAYVDKLNALAAGTRYAGMSLDEVVKKSHSAVKSGEKDAQKIFNNAAQHWNHSFFWNCLKQGGGAPSGDLAGALERDFGSVETFGKTFAEQGVEQFGSGWVWLIADGGKLAIEKGHDAMTPMAEGKTCLLTIDVWEHAYYVDYQNRRPDFLKAVIDGLLNWDFALKNYRAESLADA